MFQTAQCTHISYSAYPGSLPSPLAFCGWWLLGVGSLKSRALSFLGLLGRSTYCAGPFHLGLLRGQGEERYCFPAARVWGTGILELVISPLGGSETEHGLQYVQSRGKAWPCPRAARFVFYFESFFLKVLLKPAPHVPELLLGGSSPLSGHSF